MEIEMEAWVAHWSVDSEWPACPEAIEAKAYCKHMPLSEGRTNFQGSLPSKLVGERAHV